MRYTEHTCNVKCTTRCIDIGEQEGFELLLQPHWPLLHLCTLGVLACVNNVDSLGLSNECCGLGIHPRCDERRHIQSVKQTQVYLTGLPGQQNHIEAGGGMSVNTCATTQLT